jgi:hypothetical protein
MKHRALQLGRGGEWLTRGLRKADHHIRFARSRKTPESSEQALH